MFTDLSYATTYVTDQLVRTCFERIFKVQLSDVNVRKHLLETSLETYNLLKSGRVKSLIGEESLRTKTACRKWSFLFDNSVEQPVQKRLPCNLNVNRAFISMYENGSDS